jgi:hypothetical protein
MRSRYTFRLGKKEPTGLEFHFNVDADCSSQAVVSANVLLKPCHLGFLGLLAKRWEYLRGAENLTEDNLVGIQPLPCRQPIQMTLAFAPDPAPPLLEELVAPRFTGWVPLPEEICF